MKPLLPHLSRPLFLAAAALALAGCASLGPATPERTVQERATTFWQARLKGDLPAAYALLTPAYRGLRSQDDYARANGKQVTIEKVKVTKVSCEKDKCLATLAMTSKPMIPGMTLPEITNYMDDTWVLDDGQWWRFQAP